MYFLPHRGALQLCSAYHALGRPPISVVRWTRWEPLRRLRFERTQIYLDVESERDYAQADGYGRRS